MSDDGMFRRYANRVSQDPAFLGWQLAQFARVQNLDDASLAAYLDCDVSKLAELRTCGAVRSEYRRADVNQIATEFGIVPAKLAEATKITSLENLSELATEPQLEPEPAPVMLAARDRSETP
jgi:hypothetical protein